MLSRSNLIFELPAPLPAVSLRFEVGFATDETVVSGVFYDSFSLALRNSTRTYAAFLVTLDLFGPLWNPNGAANYPLLLCEPISTVTVFGNEFTVRSVFAVAVELPVSSFGSGGLLSLSLFDNQDAERSLGFLRNVSFGPSLNASIRVESSASASGPFATESDLQIDRVLQAIRVPGGGSMRFYRLRSDLPSRILRLRATPTDLIFEYEGSRTNVVLESSAQASGPYASESGVMLDAVSREMRLPRQGLARFYRLRSDVPLVMRRVTSKNEDFILHYELAP